MSITYEEALATLEAMFGEPWTRDTLDAVLRHEKGHMENTCDRILNHGSEDPQVLIDRLKAGGPEPQVAMDEELARQLARQGSSGVGGSQQRQSQQQVSQQKKGRGTPTTLPADFLRIPGYKHRSMGGGAGGAVSNAGGAMDDETLARMLQDEMFSQELARGNPDLARMTSRRGAPPGQRRAQTSNAGASTQPNPFEGVNIMKNLSEMGEGARRRLQMFAHNFEQKVNNTMNKNKAGGGGEPAAATGGSALPSDTGAVAERRGLLDGEGDDDEDMIEFETRRV